MGESKHSTEHAIFLGIPRGAVALVFVVVELVLLLFAALLSLPPVPIAIVSLVWLAVCAVPFALLKGSASYVQAAEERREGDWARAARARLDVARPDIPDELADEYGRLVEALRFSDPVGTQGSKALEDDFDAAFGEFIAAPTTEGIRECLNIIEKRNAVCKAEK